MRDSSDILNQEPTTFVQVWEDEFHAMKAEYLVLRTQGLWQRGASDLLSILGRERREIYHSAMLGWLFDPLAPHGLGVRFLQAFLQDLFSESCVELEASNVDMRCEEVRDNCRADIVVRTDRFTMVLENKLDAVESEAQCQRLYEAFSRDGNARFVFLSPSGSPPRTAVGASKEAFVPLSYRDLRKCLERVFNDTLDAPQTVGRQSALNYLGTLMKEFA